MASTSSSQYLSEKTSNLESQTPVPPSQARAAQIPLRTFSLPTFPPEAFSAGLTTLVLTSDIKLDEYTDLLTNPFEVADLPQSITSLTLELFSLGYPPGFLTALGQKLPNLKALTLYAQLFAGTTPQSREDALIFIKGQSSLQELHLLDVLGKPGFYKELSEALTPGLKFLEVNFTYRHSDPEFMKTLPSKEMGGFVKKDLVGLTMSVSAPDVVADDEDDREGTEVGVMVAGGKDSSTAVEKFVEAGDGLVMLDATMFDLGKEDVEKVLDACGKVKILGLTVGLENGWDDVLQVVGKKTRGVEVLEIVGVPGEALVEKLKVGGEEVLKTESLDKLSESCKGLKSLKVSILRTRAEQWDKESDTWEKKA
jgi:hypothetical protein